MKTVSKKIALMSLVALLAMPLAACNTMEGLGEDTQAAGDALENAAEDNKNY